MTDPQAGTEATNLNGIDTINQQYAQMPGQVSQQLAARGFGQSGKLGTAMYNTANARSTAQSGWQSQMAQLVSSRQMQGASLADQLLNANRGSTTTTTGPNTSMANGLMTAGNGLSNLSTLLMLQSVLGGGNGASTTLGGGGNIPASNPNVMTTSDPNVYTYGG